MCFGDDINKVIGLFVISRTLEFLIGCLVDGRVAPWRLTGVPVRMVLVGL